MARWPEGRSKFRPVCFGVASLPWVGLSALAQPRLIKGDQPYLNAATNFTVPDLPLSPVSSLVLRPSSPLALFSAPLANWPTDQLVN